VLVQYIVKDLPKTRSGKIVRRALRKIVSGRIQPCTRSSILTLALLCTITQASGEGDQLGDLSTISDPSIIDHIMQVVKKA
jgi:acetyl-CoA synthetase